MTEATYDAFERALRELRNVDFHDALVDVNDTVGFAKKILLSNKVQNFTASDVVALTDLIIRREAEARSRRLAQEQNDTPL